MESKKVARAMDAKSLARSLWSCAGERQALALLKKCGLQGDALDGLDASGHTCLNKCAMRGYAKACEELVKMGADPNARSSIHEGSLALAAIGGHVEAFEALLVLGADVSEVDSDGNGIAHKIISSQSAQCKKMLVMSAERGAIVDLPNKRGLRPLDMLRNLGLEESDPRFDAYRHLRALAEGFAIGQAAGDAPKMSRARL